MLAVALWLWLFRILFPSRRRSSRGRRFVPTPFSALRARKPDWVIEEIVRLKALMADAGCRRISDTFNRMHGARHAMIVSKTWVAVTVRARRLEIEDKRREWKRRVPKPMDANLVWGLDLTGEADAEGVVHPILGIVDHGSRLAVLLIALRAQTTVAILRALLDAIERHGLPRAVRTDNGAAFMFWLFAFALAMLGIRHQRTEPHCPWMNGRVERFFGTLKSKLNGWAVDGPEQLNLALGDFRTWYNHVSYCPTFLCC
jgi:putative transposase